MDNFAHLHVHTQYSTLDGAARIGALFTEAERLSMPALAITDHGNMSGAAEFWRRAQNSTVTPIIGIETYLAPTTRHHKKPVFWGQPDQRGDDVSGQGAYTHMTLLAMDATGLRNLLRISSTASIDGAYRKPRADRDLLTTHAQGIIGTTGCPSGEIQTRLRLGQYPQALAAAADYRDILGHGNYYLEVMDHGLDLERRVREDLLRIGRDLHLPPLATNDSHYVLPGDAPAHDAMLCLQTGAKLADTTRFRFTGTGYYLKSATEMRALFDSEIPGACDTTLDIAARAGDYSGVFTWEDRNPSVPLGPGDTQDAALRREVDRCATTRFPGGLPPGYGQRLSDELDVIATMGYSGYFLVVTDLIEWARKQPAMCRGRGSAAGSLTVYLLGITDIDPMVHGLYFERFINADRVSPPDVDLDIDERYRGEAVQYLIRRWGEANVAQVITFGTIKTKAALKDATRVLGHPFALGEQLVAALPPAIHAHDIPLAGITDPTHDRYPEAQRAREIIQSDPRAAEVLEVARGLEGAIRNAGVHACGVFLSAEPLIGVVPLWKHADGTIITGWDWEACEAVGAGMKLDVLGSTTITVLCTALTSITARHGMEVDLRSVPLDDRAAYELLARGDTVGVFQLEGQGASDTLRRIQPTRFGDICDATALYRPGPMGMNAHHEYADRKNGRAPIIPIHPSLTGPLAGILGDTYSLCIYQEQIMAIARAVAGYTLGQADLLRRAMGKKKKEILEGEFGRFSAGMAGNGYPPDAARALWDVMAPFASYAFPRSHAASYGLVSYWTAYLKAHYPVEFMAARLTSVSTKKDRMALYLAECRRMGITVLPPDINLSGGGFTPGSDGIRFGLAAVKTVGQGMVDAITQGREGGAYRSFHDYLRKVPIAGLGKPGVHALAAAGAFDSLGHSRRGLDEVADKAIEWETGPKKAEARGQGDLFAGDTGTGLCGITVPVREWTVKQLLARERDVLGLYVSAHPLDGAGHVLTDRSLTQLASLKDPDGGEAGEGGEVGVGAVDGAPVTVGGLITSVTTRTDRGGRPWVILGMEDYSGAGEVLVFASVLETVPVGVAVRDMVVLVRGRVSVRSGRVSVIASDVVAPDLTVTTATPAAEPVAVTVEVAAGAVTMAWVGALRAVVGQHRGGTELRVALATGTGVVLLRLSDELRVTPSAALSRSLEALPG